MGEDHWRDCVCGGNQRKEAPEDQELRSLVEVRLSVWNTQHVPRVQGPPQVYGGGLPGIYQFAQFHLHWGSVDSQGSEHTINQKAYPMELHLVHFKTEYGNDIMSAITNEPRGKNDNLAVLGIMFEIQDEDNEALEPMMNALEKIASTDIKTKVNMEVATLTSLLPKDT